MSALTKAQREVLEHIDKLRRDDGRGYRHYRSDTGETVRASTVAALFRQGLIRVDDWRGARTTFALTDAGRATTSPKTDLRGAAG